MFEGSRRAAVGRRVRRPLRDLPALHPTQAIVVAFLVVIAAGTALLLLPGAAEPGVRPSVSDALFTSTSAVTVTGLTVLPTDAAWTPAGQAVILLLFQLGGFGIMSAASVLGLLVARRLGLGSRIRSAAEGRGLGAGDLRSVLTGVLRVSLVIEGIVTVLLALRFWLGYGEALPTALWYGLFHAVSAFNNAGFVLFPSGLTAFAADPWICVPVMAAVLLGSFGFPVLFELARHLGLPRSLPQLRAARRTHVRRRRYTLNATVVLVWSAALLLIGAAATAALEWSNPSTLGALDPPARLLAALFHSTAMRSSGLNTVDVGAMDPVTWLATDILMFIGGGPAGTAGGIKVTTAAVLLAVVAAQVRGDGSVSIARRRLPADVQRLAVTVGVVYLTVVLAGTMAIMGLSGSSLDRSLFEAISALATVGLSTGITAELPAGAHVLLAVMMLVGRLGPVTVATALAVRRRTRLYDYAEERPIIG